MEYRLCEANSSLAVAISFCFMVAAMRLLHCVRNDEMYISPFRHCEANLSLAVAISFLYYVSSNEIASLRSQ